MIDIKAVNRQLTADNVALRETFAALVEGSGTDQSTKAMMEVLAAGLLAIHERQGLAIAVQLQTAS